MLRIAEESDIPAILDIYGPYILTSTATFEYTVPSREEFQARFCGIIARFPWLVYEEEGVILGYAYASAPFTRAAYAWCAEPSVYLRPDARGRGIGRRLYNGLEAILKYQGFQLLYALVTGENTASLSFHHALGYRDLAVFPACGFKFGRWLDLNWLQKRLTVVEIPSASPLTWAGICQDAQKLSDILGILSLS